MRGAFEFTNRLAAHQERSAQIDHCKLKWLSAILCRADRLPTNRTYERESSDRSAEPSLASLASCPFREVDSRQGQLLAGLSRPIERGEWRLTLRDLSSNDSATAVPGQRSIDPPDRAVQTDPKRSYNSRDSTPQSRLPTVHTRADDFADAVQARA
jgi:hypothetical protein